MNSVKGKVFVLVCGIIMTVFAALSIIIGIYGFFALFDLGFEIEIISIIVLLLGLIASGLSLWFGIAAISSCGNPLKGRMIVYMGVAAIILQTLGILLTSIEAVVLLSGPYRYYYQMVLDGFFAFGMVVGYLGSLVVPILYIISGNILAKNTYTGERYYENM
jgi:hypothetical protein